VKSMFRYKKKMVDVVEDVLCDVCGTSTKRSIDRYASKLSSGTDQCEYAELKADWGYCSEGRDGECYKIHFCQACYEKMLKSMKIDEKKIRVCRL